MIVALVLLGLSQQGARPLSTSPPTGWTPNGKGAVFSGQAFEGKRKVDGLFSVASGGGPVKTLVRGSAMEPSF